MGFGEALLRKLRSTRSVRGLMTATLRDGSVRYSYRFVGKGKGRPPFDGEVTWTRAPTFEAMAAAWPASAVGLDTGQAALRCAADGGGGLVACRIVGEVPQGSDFGEAALGVVGGFRMQAEGNDGVRRLDGRDVVVGFTFHRPGTSAEAARKADDAGWAAGPESWVTAPFFPETARASGVRGGIGVVDCLAGGNGRLSDCRIVGETPTGLGFGDAALRVSGQLTPNLWTRTGRPVVGARITFPVRFGILL